MEWKDDNRNIEDRARRNIYIIIGHRQHSGSFSRLGGRKCAGRRYRRRMGSAPLAAPRPQIPAHTEETAVGTGSTANGIGTTAVGAAAVATGDYSTAVGYSAGVSGSPSNTYNTAVGFAAGQGVTGSSNNASGLAAGMNVTGSCFDAEQAGGWGLECDRKLVEQCELDIWQA